MSGFLAGVLLSVTMTAYCSCRICCGKYSPEAGGHGLTASGIKPLAGWTLASRQLPFGTRVRLPGEDRFRVVEDRGGPGRIGGGRGVGPKARGWGVDVYVSSHVEAVRRGKWFGTVEVKLDGDRVWGWSEGGEK